MGWGGLGLTFRTLMAPIERQPSAPWVQGARWDIPACAQEELAIAPGEPRPDRDLGTMNQSTCKAQNHSGGRGGLS